jgi:hypothetical protein
MSSVDHENFVPCTFGIRLHDLKTIRISYDPTNFQHLSLITRLFSPAFVNHSGDEDIVGLASVIEALPSMTFILSELGIRLQFVAAGAYDDPAHDQYIDLELRSFVDAAPCGVNITWCGTFMLRRDTNGKIMERWQTSIPWTLRQLPIS